MDRNKIAWGFMFLLLLFSLALKPLTRQDIDNPENEIKSVSYSEFLTLVKNGKAKEVFLFSHQAQSKIEGRNVVANMPDDPKAAYDLTTMGADVHVVPPERPSILLSFLFSFAPFIVMMLVWLFLMKKMQGGAGGAMGFGKSRAKKLEANAKRITFEDVAGVDEAREELGEVVDFLKDPGKFSILGGKIPKGVLLVGPPGTGKTLLARAVAGEAKVPFFSISGSDFVEMFVGVGASRVRDMFETARKNAPCIIFIDEIDAMGRSRGAGIGGGNDEREQTLNQMLVEMDGFAPNEGIIIIAATNRPDVLDPALLRPGRFDRQVVVSNPDVKGREKILRVHVRNVILAPDVELLSIARGTPGFSGADLANLINEAALLAARHNQKSVRMLEFEMAKDRIMMGAERRTMTMSPEEKRLTAFHEAGHALCAVKEPYSDPIHKATILPRGRTLGMVLMLPEGDQVSMSLEKLESMMTVAMGGRVAEELVFGERKITTGASGDIKMITNLARRMVTEWGFSDKLGHILYVDQQENGFLGQTSTRQTVSDDTARIIDAEVKKIVDEATTRARKILTDNRDILDNMANALLERETLSGDEIRSLARGELLPPDTTVLIAELEKQIPRGIIPVTP